jgi:hypothetical protein
MKLVKQPSGSGPRVLYQRGLYFDGTNYLKASEAYSFAPKFSILIWAKSDKGKGGVLASIWHDSAEVASAAVNPSGSLSFKFASASVETQPISADKWKFCSFAFEFGSVSDSTLMINCLNSVQLVTVGRNLDFSYEGKTLQLTVGRQRNQDYFTGLISEISFVNESVKSSKLASYVESTGCPLSFSVCLTECALSEYQDSESNCLPCGQDCTAGCRTSDSCVLCDEDCDSDCWGFRADECCPSGTSLSEGGECTSEASIGESGTTQSEAELQEIQTQKEELVATQSTTSSGSSSVLIGSMMTGSPDIFISIFMTIEMLSYLPLINMKLTSHQVDLLVGANQVQSLPNYFPGLECTEPETSRRNYDFECTNFLRIAQKELTVLLGVLFFSTGGLLLALNVESCIPYSNGLMKKLLPPLRRLLTMVLLDVLIKATYSACSADLQSFQSLLGWIMIVAVWAFYLTLLIYSIKVACSDPDDYKRSKLFFFDDLKPTTKCQLFYALAILHRMCFAVVTVAFDSPKLQLVLISVVSLAVTSKQLALYIILIRPFKSFLESLVATGSFFVVVVFCSFLTIFEFGVMGDSKEIVSTGFSITIMSTIGLHILAMLLKVFVSAREIYQAKDQLDLTIQL